MVEKADSPSSLVKAVRSQDGTAIAFDRIGHGSPLILVDGALCYRAIGPSTPLAKLLAPHFTVFTYDRRGRGDSGDTTPYAVEREVEDLEAVLKPNVVAPLDEVAREHSPERAAPDATRSDA